MAFSEVSRPVNGKIGKFDIGVFDSAKFDTVRGIMTEQTKPTTTGFSEQAKNAESTFTEQVKP
jgi:hypothetical protein